MVNFIKNNSQKRKIRSKAKIIKNNKNYRNRIVIFRSNKNIYAQLISAINNNILTSCSSVSSDIKSSIKGKTGIEKAFEVGQAFGKKILELKISEIVFDKSSYNYNGRIKSFADGCRDSGLKF